MMCTQSSANTDTQSDIYAFAVCSITVLVYTRGGVEGGGRPSELGSKKGGGERRAGHCLRLTLTIHVLVEEACIVS